MQPLPPPRTHRRPRHQDSPPAAAAGTPAAPGCRSRPRRTAFPGSRRHPHPVRSPAAWSLAPPNTSSSPGPSPGPGRSSSSSTATSESISAVYSMPSPLQLEQSSRLPRPRRAHHHVRPQPPIPQGQHWPRPVPHRPDHRPENGVPPPCQQRDTTRRRGPLPPRPPLPLPVIEGNRSRRGPPRSHTAVNPRRSGCTATRSPKSAVRRVVHGIVERRLGQRIVSVVERCRRIRRPCAVEPVHALDARLI